MVYVKRLLLNRRRYSIDIKMFKKKPEKTSEDFSFEEVAKDRAYTFRHGNVEFAAVKFEGFKASRLGAEITTFRIGGESERNEKDDWLIIVKDEEGVVRPLDVWAERAGRDIANVSSEPGTVSIVVSPRVGEDEHGNKFMKP
jgi:hypothetical protein